MRSIFGTDIATGQVSAAGYSSKGPQSSRDIKNKLPESPPVRCNIWQIQQTCTEEQVVALMNGKAVVKDYIFVSSSSSTSVAVSVKAFSSGILLLPVFVSLQQLY
jgi:hypothetical protein